jgi:hypothetical protein
MVTQSQAALNDQLRQLVGLANKAGLYDAADFIQARLDQKPTCRTCNNKVNVVFEQCLECRSSR